MKPLEDQPARDRIATSLDESLLVEAAAGTGKTTVLVDRLVAVLKRGGTTIDRIVAVTFTRKAAGELKLRLRQELDRARAATGDGAARDHLENALARLEEAHIGTIHSFCAEILRERPVEARIDPGFEEVDDDQSAGLFDRAFQAWIERKLDEMPAGLRRALSRLARQRSFDRSTPVERLREAGRSLVDWRDFEEPWERRPFEREAAIDLLLEEGVDELAELCAKCGNRHDYLRRALEPAEALRHWVRRTEAVAERDYDELEAQLVELYHQLHRQRGWKGRGKWFAPGVAREEALKVRDAVTGALEAFRHQADADLAALLHGELGEVIADYEELKRRAGQLDFLDLLLRARDLIRGDAGVRAELQNRFTHLFVDEFQDTDPLQAEILLLLAADDTAETDWRRARPRPGKLFLVGDPKQSIYRFRRADVVLYQDLKRRLTEGGNVGLVQLQTSFRAVGPLQRAVNAAFAKHMTGDEASGQPEYIPLAPHRDPPTEQPQIVVVPAPDPFGYSRVTKTKIEACLPDVTAAFVAWLIEESGWRVQDPDDRRRKIPIAPRHVALLFRRFVSWGGDVTRGYVGALEARGVPHLLVGGRSFHQREEVETLRAALTAVEWPDDRLAVYASLRGDLFAIPDNLLLRYHLEDLRLHPFAPRPADDADHYSAIVEALDLLAELHRRRNHVPITDTVHRLLELTRAHAGFALRPAGHQVLANVERVCDLARSFEVRGGLSFRGFVELLDAEAERPGSSSSPVLEEGADGVRLMTAHAAKGLEFPVVVLADITANLARAEPGLYLDADGGLSASKLLGFSPWELRENAELEHGRDLAEGVRLAYVAATRARDLLVVPGVGTGPWEGGWLSPLNPAIYPPRQDYQASRPAPGCPPFDGASTVLTSPQTLAGPVHEAIRPGLHRPLAGEHDVVWWDPGVLNLGVEANFGLRQEEILGRDETGEVAEEGISSYRTWRDARADVLEAGSTARLDVAIVTELEEPPPGFEAEIDVEFLLRDAGRPGGKRFGTLVHTMLRDAAFDADEQTVRRLAEMHGRMLDASGDEVDGATSSVVRALAHPLLIRAAGAERCHREAPFLLARGGDGLVEGIIDLAFLEDDIWTVVDFKTDADLEARQQSYRVQLSWYVYAMREITGIAARGVLLGV
ncbi:MAG: UvrD-helicase domain-containing protein [bacterium]|nr:UvrD-helicase domain-containing protein [bacterium]